jgi:protein-tyrosine phosphatase
MEEFCAAGCTHLVTLLKESEKALAYGEFAQAAGINWIWISIPNGKKPDPELHASLVAALPRLSDHLDKGARMIIHCSAGIHRTGMLAYGLLRWRGLTQEQALEKVGQMRQPTLQGIQARQIAWGNSVARKDRKQGALWLISVKESASHWLTRIFNKR